MAATADYKYANPTIGIYGLKNPFYVIIDTNLDVFNLTYKLKVTFTNTGEVREKSVTPIGTQAVVNPFLMIEDLMFNEYTGQTTASAIRSFGLVQIEIGETYSSVANDPPTFRGYDTDDSFYVYNGYEPLMMELNYRDPNWYNTSPYKLPKLKKTVKIFPSDVEILSFPSIIAGLTAVNIIATTYNNSNVVIDNNTIDLTLEPNLTGTAYWNININQFIQGLTDYTLIKVEYTDGEDSVFSEDIRLESSICNPKQGRYRLRWANNYDGDEYQNFTLASDKIVQVQKGKRILSDGIDYTASTFATLSNVNNPNIKEVGNRVTNLRRLRTDYLTQEELNALEDLYKSDAVLMFDPDNNLLPVLVRDTSFTITDVRNELVKVEVLVEIANIER